MDIETATNKRLINGKGCEFILGEAISRYYNIDLHQNQNYYQNHRNYLTFKEQTTSERHDSLIACANSCLTDIDKTVAGRNITQVQFCPDEDGTRGHRGDIAMFFTNGESLSFSVKHQSNEDASFRIKPKTQRSGVTGEYYSSNHSSQLDETWNIYPTSTKFRDDRVGSANFVEHVRDIELDHLSQTMINQPEVVNNWFSRLMYGSEPENTLKVSFWHRKSGYRYLLEDKFPRVVRLGLPQPLLPRSATVVSRSIVIPTETDDGTKHLVTVRYKNGNSSTHTSNGLNPHGLKTSITKKKVTA